MQTELQSTMRSRTFDRLKKSIAGEAADGHSVFHYYTFPFYHHVTKVPLNEYFHNSKTMFDTQLEVLEQLNKCGSFQPDVGPVAECQGLGGQVHFDPAGFISAGASGISTMEEAMALPVGDPYGDNYMRVALEHLEYMVANAPKDVKVNVPNCMAPFTVAAQLRGISQFCMDTMMNPGLTQALLDKATETCIAYLKACQKVMGGPIHHLLLSDDISAFLSPADYAKWVVPTYEKIFAEFPESQYWLHNDSKAGHLAKAIADVGFHAWQYGPIVNSLDAAEQSGSRVTLLGGLSPVEFQGLSEQETYDACIEKLKSFGGNNKFVLGVGGSVNQIPIENLNAMFRAADDYKI